MNTKELRNVKISADAHDKISRLSADALGATRERIMELAVDMLYDLVQKEGVVALYKKAEQQKSASAPAPSTPDRGFSSPSPAIHRAQGVGITGSSARGR